MCNEGGSWEEEALFHQKTFVSNLVSRSPTTMKFSPCIAVLSVTSFVDAFAPMSNTPKVSPSALFGGVSIWYSSSTGNTETVAGYIASAAGGLQINDISDAKDSEIEGADALIVGAPTWHTGADEQRSGTSWDDWLYDTLPKLNVQGKKVAVFGVGDQQSYSDNFCDAAGELFDLLSAKGCKMYGLTPTDGYGHQASKAIVSDGKFCGLMCDEDNQYDLSEARAKAWIAQLKDEGFF
jgi:flavodoxin I